jgi:oxalate decarboxylase
MNEGLPEPVRGDDEPLRTGSDTVPDLKLSFASALNRLFAGGWAREVTSRELPIATELAGVNMRLKAGAVRETHWHKQAEWSYMISGRARITAVDDVGEGDIWCFPAGIPHSIQGLEGGCEFLLVFDEGSFSVSETCLSPHAVPSPAAAVLQRFSYRLLDQQPIRAAGVTARIADSLNFKASTTIAAALVEVEPGAIRETHRHHNTDEWQYYLGGQGRMTVFASGGTARAFDFSAGDVGYVPVAMGHRIENTGAGRLRLLEMYRSDRVAGVSPNQPMALTNEPMLAQWRQRSGG